MDGEETIIQNCERYWQIIWSKLINTPNIILVVKLEFRRAPGTNGSGCYRNHNSIAVKTISIIFVSMKSVLINLSVDTQHTLYILKIKRKQRVFTNFWDNPRIIKSGCVHFPSRVACGQNVWNVLFYDLQLISDYGSKRSILFRCIVQITVTCSAF